MSEFMTTCRCDCGNRYCASKRFGTELSWGEVDEQRRLDHQGRVAIRSRAKHMRKQSKTEVNATRYGYQWASWELRLITRPDLTTAQMAEITGRTFYAIRRMRNRLRKEKALQEVAS